MITSPQKNQLLYNNFDAKNSGKTVNEKPEKNLLRLIRQKSQKGFSILYENYANALYLVIFQIVKDKQIAEDLLQETFIKIWRKIDTYDEHKGTLYNWMLNIGRNTGIDFLRIRKNQFHKQMIRDEVVFHSDHYHPCSDTNNALAIDNTLIRNETFTLDRKYAEVIDMIYFAGYTYEQAANILQLPVGTLKTRARRALTLLKRKT